jgi:hypothetical protein
VRTLLGVLLVACLWQRTAHAGRDYFAWSYGTDVMPERGVELQTWYLEVNDKYSKQTRESWIWWGPLIGVTDQLELAIPVELEWLLEPSESDPMMPRTSFALRRWGVEARYRLVSADPVEAPAFVPLVRVAAKRAISGRDDARFEADLVASFETGPVQVLADLGFMLDIAGTNRHTEVRPSGGVSIRVADGLRLGAEVYSELGMDNDLDYVSWAVVGPNVAWTHGRFWLSAAFGIGVYHVRTAPRVMWGIAF